MRRFLGSSLAVGAIAIAVASFGFTSVSRAADTDGYVKVTSVDVGKHAITCFGHDVSNFTFDISWVNEARGEYLLAESSHGNPSSDTEGGLLSGATDGDVLLIHTDNTAAGPTFIKPPRNDPFAGRRCDVNVDFGGVPGNPSRNEISGPNGLFTVNDIEVWVGDGPSRFVPGQTDSASDYITDPCDSSVRVFSLLTRQQTDHINVHGCFRTDEGAFDPVDQVALFANPSEQPTVAAINHNARAVAHSSFITLISTVANGDGDEHANEGHGHHKILKQINFDGKNGTINANAGIEQAVYVRQTGKFYIAIPGTLEDGDDGFLAVVDPVALEVVANIPLPGCAPTGNALGPNETLILGCGPAHAYDIKTGTLTTITGAPGAPACDEVAYDAGSGHFGSACITFTSAGKFDLLLSDAHTLTFDADLGGAPPAGVNAGASGAHSVTADSETATFWLPAYQPPNQASGPCSGPDHACVAVYGGDQSDASGD